MEIASKRLTPTLRLIVNASPPTMNYKLEIAGTDPARPALMVHVDLADAQVGSLLAVLRLPDVAPAPAAPPPLTQRDRLEAEARDLEENAES